MIKKLILGVIGGSIGNGHPFSWSAIFNGYDPEKMSLSGYPVISEYLRKEKWPEARLNNASVDYVYTPDPVLSSKIAAASRVKNIIAHPEDMLHKVDALLLARDDPENHLHFAKTFLQAGLPVFVDKPIALSVFKLNELLSFQKHDRQIFSCSAFSHAEELELHNLDNRRIGKIHTIVAETPNSWQKYGVHIVEPLIKYLNGLHHLKVTRTSELHEDNLTVSFINDDGVNVKLRCLGNGSNKSLTFKFFGSDGATVVEPTNYYNYFKNSLSRFVTNIIQPNEIWETSVNHHTKVTSILELGA